MSQLDKLKDHYDQIGSPRVKPGPILRITISYRSNDHNQDPAILKRVVLLPFKKKEVQQ